MAITDINSEDRLVQKTFAYHLENVLGWENVYAHNDENVGPPALSVAPANAMSSSSAIFTPC